MMNQQSLIARTPYISGVIFLSVLIVMVSGCGKAPGGSQGYPPAGHMTMLSMEMAGDVYKGPNLISNGDFSVWPDDIPSPEGFSVPRDTKISKVVRIDARGGKGTYSADQWWRASDKDIPYTGQFHTIVPGIQANRVYELSVLGLSYYYTTASISVIALDSSNREVGRWTDLIKIAPANGGEQNLSRTIKTLHDGALVIYSHGNEKTVYGEKTRICWLEWQLMQTSGVNARNAVLPDKD